MVAGSTAVQLGIVVATVLGLWVGARLLVDSVVRLARRAGLSELTIGLTIVAAGTSTPELVVTADAALNGLGDIAVANVLGSNVYNLAFILGVVALFRAIPIAETLVRRDGVVLLASTLVGGAVLFDLTVTRLEGGVLLGLFLAYTGYLLASERATAAETSPTGETERDDAVSAVTRKVTERVAFPGRDVVFLVVGLAIVLVSGDLLVGAASTLARGAGVSEWVIGGTVVAAGTSTPEFAVSLVAIRRGSLGVSVGNVVGSNVFNVLAVMGLGAVFRPLTVSPAALETLGWLLVVSAVMVAALWTGRVLSRVEGALFAGSELVRWTLGLLG
ncbi:cation:H+ antiporter [Halogranum gelatinilyticum]|uniref:Cation:H+ antiporter n=1 Tax=Halogranum gelatinilyticum TaxID=660521 RepID=A0A1G9NP59_9EURY|nr:calcium/sodium antiporter [Halogranum gelatinilyticum]SDL88141.1 cation:H+ antiporter [Halogranum gelatinilyticum]